MSDDTKKHINDWGVWGFRGLVVLVLWFAAQEFNDMKEAIHEVKAEIKEISNTVVNTREIVVGNQKDIESHDKRIEKLERHSGR